MTNIYKKSVLIFTLISTSVLGFGQPNEIKVRFIGNCGLYITDGKANLYLDFPYKSGAHHYMEYDPAEIANIKENAILIYTHGHSDHYSKKLAKKVSKKIYGPWNVKALEELSSSLENFSIETFKTKHRFSFKHCSYLITWHGKRIFVSGDTEHAETLASLKEIDWTFAPVWLLMDAMKKGVNIKALSKMYGVYHIGPRDKITNDDNDPQIKLLNKQGETITIPY